MITTNNTVNVNHEVYFAYRGLRYKQYEHAHRDWRPKFSLIRNISDDTFYLEIESAFHDPWDPYPWKPYIDIDHKVVLGNEVQYPSATQDENHITKFKVSSGALNRTKLSDVHQMVVGISHNGGGPIVMFQISFRQNMMTTNQANLTGNKVLKFKFLKKLDFVFDSVVKTRDAEYCPEKVSVSRHYANSYFVPRRINRLNYINDVMDIYSDEDDMDDAIADNMITPGLRNSSAVAKGLHTRLNYNIDHSDVIAIQEGESTNNIKKVGTISLIDQSFYNYKTGKTVIGVDTTSQVGEIIPYNFKGNYVWQQHIDGYGMLKDFIISSSEKYNTPILNQTDGAVRLQIDDTYSNHLRSRYEILGDQIDELKKITEPTLNSLMRLSHEKMS